MTDWHWVNKQKSCRACLPTRVELDAADRQINKTATENNALREDLDSARSELDKLRKLCSVQEQALLRQGVQAPPVDPSLEIARLDAETIRIRVWAVVITVGMIIVGLLTSDMIRATAQECAGATQHAQAGELPGGKPERRIIEWAVGD